MDSETDATAQTIDPYPHRQLFLDDHAVEESSGVRRVLHQPERLGAILKPDVSRDQMALQSKSPPWWNPELGVWEWWYWAMYDEVPGQMYASEGRVSHYATSTDGVNWDTPPLGLHELRGSKDNNVAYDTSERGLALYHIIRDDSDPDPERRFKGIFAHGRPPARPRSGLLAQRLRLDISRHRADPKQGHLQLSSRPRA